MKNVSHGPVQVVVTGDLRDNIVPLWGPTLADLKPAPDNAFRLEARGISGDTMTGYLGLRFLNISGGTKQTTIIFRAREIGVPTGASRIAFTSNKGGYRAISVMDSDGSNQTGLSDTISVIGTGDGVTGDVIVPAFGDSPAWSPDGSKIAFASNRHGNSGIFVMNSDGSNQTRVTKTPDSESYPDWSPGAVSAIIVPAAAMTLDQGSDEFGAGGVGTGAYPTEPFDPRPERR